MNFYCMFPNLDTNVNTAFRHVNWEQYPTGPTKLKSASFYVHPCYQGSVSAEMTVEPY